MTRRHAPIPALTVELVPGYRCPVCGNVHLYKKKAYECAGWCVVKRQYGSWVVTVGGRGLARRVSRWLRWRDGRIASMAERTER